MKKYNKDNTPLAQKLRREPTRWERKLWYDFLNKYPVRFQRQKPISNYIVDFYCAKAKLIVELDGYYHTTDKQYQEDKQRDQTLLENNVEVIRFKNSEIDTDFERVCKQIDALVRRRMIRDE